MGFKIKISEMSGKLKDIQAINTNPLTNDFCRKMHDSGNNKIICTECYSCAMLKAYRKNCVPAFENNSDVLSNISLTEKDIPKIKTSIVRIHAHGELINQTHLQNILMIVKHYPEKTFSLYTKRLDIINEYCVNNTLPSNLIMVYSNPLIDNPITTVPAHFNKVFNVCRTSNVDKINCGARSCDGCRRCYDLNKDNIIYEMIK
jgi:hypothetical protein